MSRRHFVLSCRRSPATIGKRGSTTIDWWRSSRTAGHRTPARGPASPSSARASTLSTAESWSPLPSHSAHLPLIGWLLLKSVQRRALATATSRPAVIIHTGASLLSTHADSQIKCGYVAYCFVCLFVGLFCVCTITDFSAEDKASGVKFCTVVHRRRGQGIARFGELCSPRSSPRSPKSEESVASPALRSHGAGDARVRTGHA